MVEKLIPYLFATLLFVLAFVIVAAVIYWLFFLKSDETAIKKIKKELDHLTRQARRKLNGNDKLLDHLLTAQQMLTKARHLNPNTSEEEVAQKNLQRIFEEEITGSNLSWEEAENLCAIQEELMIMENKIEVPPKN